MASHRGFGKDREVIRMLRGSSCRARRCGGHISIASLRSLSRSYLLPAAKEDLISVLGRGEGVQERINRRVKWQHKDHQPGVDVIGDIVVEKNPDLHNDDGHPAQEVGQHDEKKSHSEFAIQQSERSGAPRSPYRNEECRVEHRNHHQQQQIDAQEHESRVKPAHREGLVDVQWKAC